LALSELWGFSIGISLIILLGAVLAGLFLALINPSTKIRKKQFDLMKITIDDIDRMNRKGDQFENYLCVLITALGYKYTYQTNISGDFGADVIFTDSKGKRTVVQAKNYSKSTTLGNNAVQETYAAIPFYSAEKGIIITSTNDITKPCRQHATACNIKIIDRSELVKIIKFFKKGLYSEAKNILEGDPERVVYTPKNLITAPTVSNTKITSGEYYYNIPVVNKKSG